MKKFTRVVFTVLRIAIGVALLVFLWKRGFIDWSRLGGLFRSWPITLAAFVLLLIDMVVTAWRLVVLLKPRGLKLSVSASSKLTLIGIFFNACLPGATGGDVMKIYYIAEGNRGRRTELATIVLFDRAAGMFALMIWPLLAALFFPSLIARLPALQAILAGAGLVGFALLVGFLIARSEAIRRSRWMNWLLAKMPLGVYFGRIYDTVFAYRHNTGVVLASVGISLIAHTMSVGVTMLMAAATNPEGVAAEMAVLIPLGHLANTVPLTPGGLGVGEAAFDSLFTMAGLKGGAETLLGWRVMMILVGLVGLFFYLQGRRRFVHHEDEMERRDTALVSGVPSE